ncbi:TonB-dependent receptor [Flammeovirga aprica]|uniref:TonB-dependent receptor n=1 Tax=Flammeovirga aprica JL-4 TaxID=694437 RepID=A0A7X9RTV2_9BACT|nr:hypothetical protein [Flammeovirga aprica]NME68044.1 hypothetical protein [Flammeovirga aprica JL-4]
MKFFNILFLFNLLSLVTLAYEPDSLNLNADTTEFKTSNAFLINESNYETFNNSFITGNATGVIRNQNNPQLMMDGIPINPYFTNNTHYNEFLGPMHLLAYDIQSLEMNTLENNNQIVSGNFNNAINFNTYDIQLGENAPKFEVNNLTSLEYQNSDTLGYSTVFNFKAEKSYDKFGYRLSLNNGYQDDYIVENGLQRFGGNIKLKHQLSERILLNGFIDYTNLKGLNRTEEKSAMLSKRLLSYLGTDISVTDALSLKSKYSINHVTDNAFRSITQSELYSYEGRIFDSFSSQNDYGYKSSFFDIGLQFNKINPKNNLFHWSAGFSQNKTKYSMNTQEKRYLYGSDNVVRQSSKLNPEEKENTFYAKVKIQRNFYSISYLINHTNYNYDLSFISENNKSFTNQLLSLKLDLIKNKQHKVVNTLGIEATYGKLANYYFTPYINSQNFDDRIIENINDNIEFNLLSSFLGNTLHLRASYYQKIYDDYQGTISYYVPNGSSFSKSIIVNDNLGKMKQSGYELIANAKILKNAATDWSMGFTYSNNVIELQTNQDLYPIVMDATVQNNLFTITNSFRLNNLQFFIEFEGKNGADIHLYKNNISGALPYAHGEDKIVTGVNNWAVPSVETIEEIYNYIPETNYFILKNIGVNYKINSHKSNNQYTIGLQYNRMRRFHYYVKNAELYSEHFQKPSFFDTVSLSLKAQF